MTLLSELEALLKEKDTLGEEAFRKKFLVLAAAQVGEFTRVHNTSHTSLVFLELRTVKSILDSCPASRAAADPLAELRSAQQAVQKSLMENLDQFFATKAAKIGQQKFFYEKVRETYQAMFSTTSTNLSAQDKMFKEHVERAKGYIKDCDAFLLGQANLKALVLGSINTGNPGTKQTNELLAELRSFIKSQPSAGSISAPKNLLAWDRLAQRVLNNKPSAAVGKAMEQLSDAITKCQDAVDSKLDASSIDQAIAYDIQLESERSAREAVEQLSAERVKAQMAEDTTKKISLEKISAEEKTVLALKEKEKAELLVKTTQQANEELRKSNDALGQELERATNRSKGPAPSIAYTARSGGIQNPLLDWFGMLWFWSLERTVLVVHLMAELRMQEERIRTLQTDERRWVVNHQGVKIPEAMTKKRTDTEAIKEQLRLLINELAACKKTPLEGVQSLEKMKLSTGEGAPERLLAYTYVCRFAAKEEINVAEQLTLPAKVGSRFAQAVDPILESGHCPHVQQYEFYQRLVSLYADGGANSLLPLDEKQADAYEVLIEKLIFEQRKDLNQDKYAWDNAVEKQKAQRASDGHKLLRKDLKQSNAGHVTFSSVNVSETANGSASTSVNGTPEKATPNAEEMSDYLEESMTKWHTRMVLLRKEHAKKEKLAQTDKKQNPVNGAASSSTTVVANGVGHANHSASTAVVLPLRESREKSKEWKQESQRRSESQPPASRLGINPF